MLAYKNVKHYMGSMPNFRQNPLISGENISNLKLVDGIQFQVDIIVSNHIRRIFRA